MKLFKKGTSSDENSMIVHSTAPDQLRASEGSSHNYNSVLPEMEQLRSYVAKKQDEYKFLSKREHEEWYKITICEFTKLYRSLAVKIHPDKCSELHATALCQEANALKDVIYALQTNQNGILMQGAKSVEEKIAELERINKWLRERKRQHDNDAEKQKREDLEHENWSRRMDGYDRILSDLERYKNMLMEHDARLTRLKTSGILEIPRIESWHKLKSDQEFPAKLEKNDPYLQVKVGCHSSNVLEMTITGCLSYEYIHNHALSSHECFRFSCSGEDGIIDCLKTLLSKSSCPPMLVIRILENDKLRALLMHEDIIEHLKCRISQSIPLLLYLLNEKKVHKANRQPCWVDEFSNIIEFAQKHVAVFQKSISSNKHDNTSLASFWSDGYLLTGPKLLWTSRDNEFDRRKIKSIIKLALSPDQTGGVSIPPLSEIESPKGLTSEDVVKKLRDVILAIEKVMKQAPDCDKPFYLLQIDSLNRCRNIYIQTYEYFTPEQLLSGIHQVVRETFILYSPVLLSQKDPSWILRLYHCIMNMLGLIFQHHESSDKVKPKSSSGEVIFEELQKGFSPRPGSP